MPSSAEIWAKLYCDLGNALPVRSAHPPSPISPLLLFQKAAPTQKPSAAGRLLLVGLAVTPH